MAEEKKVLPATKPAETAEANTTATVKSVAPASEAKPKTTNEKVTPAVKKPAAKKPPVKKPAVAKPAAKKVEAKKPAAKKAAPAKKAAAPKKAPVKKGAAVKSIDVLTTAFWNKIKKSDVKKIAKPIAIQVNVSDLNAVFHIEIKENGEKQINQTEYNDRNGVLIATYDELLKISAGKYDYLNAIKNNKIQYQGDLKKATDLAELLK